MILELLRIVIGWSEMDLCSEFSLLECNLPLLIMLISFLGLFRHNIKSENVFPLDIMFFPFCIITNHDCMLLHELRKI
jgi:hypothetical protein